MYIEFELPQGAAGAASVHAVHIIYKQLDEWSTTYDIPYKAKRVKGVLKVTLPDKEQYTFFGLTWQPRFYSTKRYRLIEPMDPPK